MMKEYNGEAQNLRRLIPLYAACYLLWFGFAALSFWTILIARDATLGLLTVVGPWVMGAVDKFSLFLFGLTALGWILYSEDYLRSGIEKGTFWRRVGRVAVIQFAVLGLFYVLKFLAVLV